MRHRRNIVWAALLAGAILLPGAARAVDGDRFGEVRLLTPPGTAQGMVIMFSDRDGWTLGDQATAAALAQAGALVAGIDSRYYTTRLNEIDEPCHVLIGDAESLSREIQRAHGGDSYHTPILFGVGAGGALAAATLGQAPANTIDGAVTLDTGLDTGTDRPACSDPASRTVDPHRIEHGPGALHGFWAAAFRPGAPAARQALVRWAADGTPVSVQDRAADETEPATALRMIGPHLQTSAAMVGTVAGLPLIELPAAQPDGRMAIVLSGDGGWRDIDKSVAEALQAQGVSVVGWDCLRYFWHAKTPEEVADALAAVMRSYGARWHARQIALVGYSFGADVLPFAFNRLPHELRTQVTLMSLLGFAKAADFEIRLTGWLGAPPSAAALPVAPEMARTPPALVQCFYGAEEDDTACPDLAGTGAEVIRTTGGHHFDGDYAALARRIVAGLARRGG